MVDYYVTTILTLYTNKHAHFIQILSESLQFHQNIYCFLFFFQINKNCRKDSLLIINSFVFPIKGKHFIYQTFLTVNHTSHNICNFIGCIYLFYIRAVFSLPSRQ